MLSVKFIKNVLNDVELFLKNMKNMKCIPTNKEKLITSYQKLDIKDNYDNTSKKLKFWFDKITLWQHPNFFAFFPSTIINPSILGNFFDILFGSYSLNNKSFNETELKVVEKYLDLFKIPKKFSFKNGGVGFLNSTCGYSSLQSILIARYLKKNVKKSKLVIYVTDMSHNHIEKSIVLNDIKHIRKIKTKLDESKNINSDFEELEKTIKKDIEEGLVPFYLCGVFGSTNLGYIVDIKKFVEIKNKYDMLFFLDSAYGGTYMGLENLEENKYGLNDVDIISINLSKSFGWGMGTNLTLIQNREKLYKNFDIDTKSNNLDLYKINPEFHTGLLKNELFLFNYNMKEFDEYFKFQFKLKETIKEKIKNTKNLELFYECKFPLVSFRFVDEKLDLNQLNKINEIIMNEINKDGKYFLVGSDSFGYFYLRISIGNIINLDEKVFLNFLDHTVDLGKKLAEKY